MIKLLIVDDHPIVRDGLKHILEDSPLPISTDEASDGQEAIKRIWKNDYDMVLLDISMPGRDGLDVLRQIKSIKPDLSILILSMLPEELYGARTLRAGASGYLTKTKSHGELLKAIQKIISGKRYISVSLARKMAFSFENGIGTPAFERLSGREFQVMRMLALGKSIKEIADEMSLSEKAIFKTRSSVKQKMKMRNNTEIICYAVEQGLVE